MNHKTHLLPGNVRVISDFFKKEDLDSIFSFCDEKIKLSHKLPLLFGKVVPLLFDLYPEIKQKIVSDKLKIILAENIGIDINNLVISKHSDYHKNTLSSWHDDLGSQKKYISLRESRQNEIFKFALIKKAEGCKKNISTEFKFNKKRFKPNINNGDIIIFPVNIMHRGYPGSPIVSSIKKVFPKLFAEKTSYFLVNSLSNLLEKRDREAIFFTFGTESEILRRFEEKNLLRAREQLYKYSIEALDN